MYLHCTEMKFSIKDFFRRCDHIHRKLLLKKSLMENFIFCAVTDRVHHESILRSWNNGHGIVSSSSTSVINTAISYPNVSCKIFITEENFTFRMPIQRRIYNPVEHPPSSFFAKVVDG